MSIKNRLIFFISFVLIALSIGSAIASYYFALHSLEAHVKNSSMPLTINNTFTKIQKNILEPTLISSLMANNTFVRQWLKDGEVNTEAMSEYLLNIKQKHHLLSTFFVSEKSKNYYTPEGIIYQVKKGVPENQWYYDFKDSKYDKEINLDLNTHIDNGVIFFINNKIFNGHKFLGACGTALDISSIREMFKEFYTQHHFTVFFSDAQGKVLLSDKSTNSLQDLNNDKEIQGFKKRLLSPHRKVFSYEKDGKSFLITSKFIKELKIYVIVKAKTSDFTKHFEDKLYSYILAAISIAFISLIIMLMAIYKYQKRLENFANMDTLTSLYNRRFFNQAFSDILALSKRAEDSLSLVFIDIDDFKKVNDLKGHAIGDQVLQRLAFILKSSLRSSDILARWGGEEFAIVLPRADVHQAEKLAHTLRDTISRDEKLIQLTDTGITLSMGITSRKENDSTDKIFSRADKALYTAKETGKNKSVVLL